MTWPQYLSGKARDFTRLLRPDEQSPPVRPEPDGGEEYQHHSPGWTPDKPTTPSVLDETPPPAYVPMHDYSGDNWRDHNIEPETFEAADWRDHADDLHDWWAEKNGDVTWWLAMDLLDGKVRDYHLEAARIVGAS